MTYLPKLDLVTGLDDINFSVEEEFLAEASLVLEAILLNTRARFQQFIVFIKVCFLINNKKKTAIKHNLIFFLGYYSFQQQTKQHKSKYASFSHSIN